MLSPTKRCTRCGEIKVRAEFSPNGKGNKIKSRCKVCLAHLHRHKYINSSPEFKLALRLSRHGMTIAEYEQRIASQDGRCLVCQRPSPILVIDHDHRCCPSKDISCGRCTRGLLCSDCNRAIGFFRDNPETVWRAAEYLAAPR